MSEKIQSLGITLNELKIDRKVSIRDLWNHKDLGISADLIEAEIPPHGVVLYKLKE